MVELTSSYRMVFPALKAYFQSIRQSPVSMENFNCFSEVCVFIVFKVFSRPCRCDLIWHKRNALFSVSSFLSPLYGVVLQDPLWPLVSSIGYAAIGQSKWPHLISFYHPPHMVFEPIKDRNRVEYAKTNASNTPSKWFPTFPIKCRCIWPWSLHLKSSD